MTHIEFKACWDTACRHRHAIYDRETCGGMLFGTWWHVSVGRIKLTLFHSPYIEGASSRDDIRPVCMVNDKGVIDGDVKMSNEMALACLKLWEVRQCLNVRSDKEWVLKNLEA